MTPKQKAKELVDIFFNNTIPYLGEKTRINQAKQCALICVDASIKAVDECKDYPHYSNLHYTDWQEVKQEIENM